MSVATCFADPSPQSPMLKNTASLVSTLLTPSTDTSPMATIITTTIATVIITFVTPAIVSESRGVCDAEVVQVLVLVRQLLSSAKVYDVLTFQQKLHRYIQVDVCNLAGRRNADITSRTHSRIDLLPLSPSLCK